MILAAVTLPVVVAVAALAIGASMVRSADSEVQRTANLAALAAAANTPILGRPQINGLPSIPTTMDDASEVPAPPTPSEPADTTAYAVGSIYKSLFDAETTADKRVADKLHLGSLVQKALGSGWTQACTVGEAQYAAGRAKIGRTYAAEKDASGNPVVPHCAVNGVFNDGTAIGDEHIWVRPEMESTGMYRLQRCFQMPADCTSQLGMTETQSLASIGSNFSTLMDTALGGAPAAGCLIDPVATGCPFNSTTAGSLFGSSAASVTTAFKSQIQSITGMTESTLSPLTGSLSTLGGLIFGKSALTNACSTALGPASGETLCNPGINLASLLPSVFVPRVRVVVHHAVDFPFVPSITGASVGDFDFGEMALARRSFKNAVVLPTLPANFGPTFGADQSACLRGKSLLSSVFSNPTFSLLGGTLTALDSLLGTLVAPISGGTSVCANAEADGSAPSAGNVGIDLNPTLAVPQKDLVAAVGAMNGLANSAVNTVVGATVGRPASECDQSPPAAWCVNVGSQLVRDLTDLYNPPSGGSAPTAGEVMQRAAQSGEDVNIVALGKTITIPLGGTAVSAGGAISAITYWIPALDVIPATVTHYDPAHPNQTTIQIDSAPHGLFKAILLDPKSDMYPLCADTPSINGYCFDQPPS